MMTYDDDFYFPATNFHGIASQAQHASKHAPTNLEQEKSRTSDDSKDLQISDTDSSSRQQFEKQVSKNMLMVREEFYNIEHELTVLNLDLPFSRLVL